MAKMFEGGNAEFVFEFTLVKGVADDALSRLNEAVPRKMGPGTNICWRTKARFGEGVR